LLTIKTLNGDLTGTIHVLNGTTLDVHTVTSLLPTSLTVYPLGIADLPSNVTMDGASLKFISCGELEGLTDLSFFAGAELELCGGPYVLNSLYVGDGCTARLVCFDTVNFTK
jgi:hypothetical protein